MMMRRMMIVASIGLGIDALIFKSGWWVPWFVFYLCKGFLCIIFVSLLPFRQLFCLRQCWSWCYEILKSPHGKGADDERGEACRTIPVSDSALLYDKWLTCPGTKQALIPPLPLCRRSYPSSTSTCQITSLSKIPFRAIYSESVSFKAQ